MRVLVVHQNAPGQYKHIIAHFVRQPGCEVVVLSQRDDRQIAGARWVTYPVPDLSTLQPHRFMIGTEVAIANAEAVLHTARTLKQEGFTPDLMLGHNAWGETLFLKDVWPDAPLMSFFEFFYAARGVDVGFDPEWPSGIDDGPRLRVRNSVNLLGLDTADWGQSPTQWQRSRYPRRYQERISVFHEGIDTSLLSPNPERRVSLANGAPPLKVGDEIITYVSRNLEPYRGFHTVMRALPEILRRRPRAQVLVIGGDGVSYGNAPSDGRTHRQVMMDEVGAKLDLGRVHFLGALPYDHYRALLQISAVHIYLTYPFVLSWSMLEAMSSGCLVIGSATPPVEEVIRDGENGLLVDFFSPAQLADRVDEVLDHRDRMAEVRRRARETILARYDLQTVCLPRFLKTVDDLLNHRTPDTDPTVTAPPPPPPRVEIQGTMTVDQVMTRASEAVGRGDYESAIGLYAAIINQKRDHAESLYQLGLVLYRQRRLLAARSLIRRAIALSPDVPWYMADLGVVLNGLRRHSERLVCYQRAQRLSPDNHAIQMNLGAVLYDLGRIPEAEAASLRALEMRPGHFGVLVNLANAQYKLGKYDQAVANYRQALSLNAQSPDIRRNLGMILMLQGQMKEGSAYYEDRLLTEELGDRHFDVPRWRGEPLNGRTLFLHVEQGIGDTLNFCRYIPLIKARGPGRIILEAQPALVPLLQGLEGCDGVVAKDDPLPPIDLYCPLLSLMHVMGTTVATVPDKTPYLTADPGRVAAMAPRLPDHGRLKVGLVWGGSPLHMNDHHRSLPLDALTPLLDVPGVDFYSLQVGPPREQIAGSAFAGRITDLGSGFNDFADTAAAVTLLDLVISVDTSVVHLAGALNRPCWVLLPFCPDWRWLLEREDTPWYPSVRLFRQSSNAEWPEVIERVAGALAPVAGTSGPLAGIPETFQSRPRLS